MQEPRLSGEQASLLILLVVFAFSSLGFAVYGLVFGTDFQLDLGKRPGAVELKRAPAPDLDFAEEFWNEVGYLLLHRSQEHQVQPLAGGDSAWIQGQETWVLVPTKPDLDLAPSLFQLCQALLQDGWVLQLETVEYGYKLGFWSSLEDGERVLTLVWNLEQLSPKNYSQHQGEVVQVLGEPFDARGFLKGTPERPVLAIIIDDWGHNSPAAPSLLAYPLPLTVAVLPHLGLSYELSEGADSVGHQVILHQPMEPRDSTLALGPGGIYQGMTREEIQAVLEENLASLPTAVGMNNHMGSLATEDPETMRAVLEVIRERGLFFVDSRTSNLSVVPEVAAEVGVPFSVNNLFLDNESDVEKIKAQLRQGLKLAEQQGQAVVIGHVRPATAEALWEMIPELLSSGVELVPISSLLIQVDLGEH